MTVLCALSGVSSSFYRQITSLNEYIWQSVMLFLFYEYSIALSISFSFNTFAILHQFIP